MWSDCVGSCYLIIASTHQAAPPSQAPAGNAYGATALPEVAAGAHAATLATLAPFGLFVDP